jgi:hypothetical protein
MMNYLKQVTQLRKISPVRKVLPDLITTRENIPAVDTPIYKTFAGAGLPRRNKKGSRGRIKGYASFRSSK